MPGTPIFHVGVLVHDLDAGVKRFSAILGLTFGEAQVYPVQLEWDGQRHSTDVRFCYSVEGPPYLELIETQDNDGPFGKANGEGLHHIAAWESSIERRLNALPAIGAAPEVVIFGEDDEKIAAYLSPDAAMHTRIELNLYEPRMPGYTPELPGTGF
jgi:catechol 2,3-dioxygenase-like lactoylglutathione lyase family enzyme